ncbi:MAG: hypothetical protein KKA79_03410 [Nanoarchaeota archaeon]|nr:hypothetical protein [Nanoarchaeota archaeon]
MRKIYVDGKGMIKDGDLVVDDLRKNQIKKLERKLQDVLKSELKDFSEIKGLNKSGLYLIFEGTEIIYVGKTEREGKMRLREMVSDYRSHTFNKKLLKKHLEKKYEFELKSLKKDSKKELISQGILNEDEFKKAQRKINNYIKEKLKFKFIEIEDDDLISIEHFAIAILKPIYND